MDAHSTVYDMAHSAAVANVLLLKRRADDRQREALRRSFQKADENGDGHLDVQEYSALFKKLHITVDQSEIESVFKGNTSIPIKELMQNMSDPGSDPVVKKALKTFEMMDRDKDGFVTKREFLGISSKITPAQVNAVFARNDTNNDGRLSKDEYVDMIKKPSQVKRNDIAF